MISKEFVEERLAYDAATGEFKWKISRGRAVAGRRAGHLRPDGYEVIVLDKIPYKAHRLAWLIMTGEMPCCRIDHRDNDSANNAWLNLRCATHSENMANRKLNANNAVGLKGVCFHPSTGKFMASANKDRKRYYLGLFDTAEAAHAAYVEKSKELHGHFSRAS